MDRIALPTVASPAPAERTLLERLEELRRRYRREEISLQTALQAAEALLDRWTRELWESRHPGEAPSPFLLRRLAQEVQAQVEQLERDLVDVRSALTGTSEEIESLRDRQTAGLVG